MKILFIAAMLSLIAIGNADAQKSNKNKTITLDQDVYCGWYLEPYDEIAAGLTHWIITIWENGKGQFKIKGEWEGMVTGNIYTISQVWNSYLPDYSGTGPYHATDVGSFVVELDGVPVVTEHWLYHITINANGEITAEVDKYFYKY